MASWVAFDISLDDIVAGEIASVVVAIFVAVADDRTLSPLLSDIVMSFVSSPSQIEFG